MSKLLQAFDAYHDFDQDTYFTLSYDTLPSEMILEVPLTAKKKNMETVLDILKLKDKGFEVVFKNWDTEDASNADFSLDFPHEQLFKAQNRSCTLWISLRNDTLRVEFLYDCKDLKLEEWIIQTNHLLRCKFGLDRTPTFNVLTKAHDRFDTENVRTEIIKVNIKENYNDDFEQVNTKIEDALTAQHSGLILLHGHPGTGKTTYIKSIISKYQNLNFIFIQNEFINQLLEPNFISFLLKQRNAILIIEDAEKVITSREHAMESSVVSTILQLTDGLFSDYLNIKVICTFNTNISKIDSALLRKGRMIAMYKFIPLTVEKTNFLLTKAGLEPQHKEMTIADIYNYQQENFNTKTTVKRIGFHT